MAETTHAERHGAFELECDRLSRAVDANLFDRLRWERREGPMLARLIALAQAALESRSEFELVEEGATRDVKRFILKVHQNRVAAVSMRIEGDQAVIQAHPIERSAYRIAEGPPIAAANDEIDGPWMETALQTLFGRVAG